MEKVENHGFLLTFEEHKRIEDTLDYFEKNHGFKPKYKRSAKEVVPIIKQTLNRDSDYNSWFKTRYYTKARIQIWYGESMNDDKIVLKVELMVELFFREYQPIFIKEISIEQELSAIIDEIEGLWVKNGEIRITSFRPTHQLAQALFWVHYFPFNQ